MAKDPIMALLEDKLMQLLLGNAATPPSPDPFQNAIPRGSPMGVNAMEEARKDPVWEAYASLHRQQVPYEEIVRRLPNYPGGGSWGWSPTHPTGMQDVMNALIKIFGSHGKV